MLSKNTIKYLKRLEDKKFRDSENLFVCEGTKIVLEAISSGFPIRLLISSENWLENNLKIQFFRKYIQEIVVATDFQIEKASNMVSPQNIIAIVEKPHSIFDENSIGESLSLVFENIQDPGNFGNIIRIADWFGIKNIFCSNNSVDVFNPKVVQASMGSIFRISVHYTNLADLLEKFSSKNNFTIYGTFLSGLNIYTENISQSGMIVFGNESSGISEDLAKLIEKKIVIPSFASRKTSDSLNISAATAIVCSEFRRR